MHIVARHVSEQPTSTPDGVGRDGAASSWLTPGVRGIGAASLLADIGHEIPTALLPSLLTGTLGAPAAALGLIEGVSDGLAGAARLGGGALADDPQRRRAAAVGGVADRLPPCSPPAMLGQTERRFVTPVSASCSARNRNCS